MPGLRVDHLDHIIKQSLKYQDLGFVLLLPLDRDG
jgi:hypothetical protein